MCEKCVELGKSVQMWSEKVAEAQEKGCGNLVHHLEDSLAVAHIKYVDALNSCAEDKNKLMPETERWKINVRYGKVTNVSDTTRFWTGIGWVDLETYDKLVADRNKQELKKLEGYVTERELYELALCELINKSYLFINAQTVEDNKRLGIIMDKIQYIISIMDRGL